MFIDTNLLVLLVVGETDKALISRHRRTKAYQMEDYELLVRLINETDHQVFVTPNTLTEASNLLAQHGEPERSRIFGVLQALIETTEEKVIESKAAARNSNFRRLGLTYRCRPPGSRLGIQPLGYGGPRFVPRGSGERSGSRLQLHALPVHALLGLSTLLTASQTGKIRTLRSLTAHPSLGFALTNINGRPHQRDDRQTTNHVQQNLKINHVVFLLQRCVPRCGRKLQTTRLSQCQTRP